MTQQCGFDHAEVQAIKKAGENSQGAEMYVTLEPCCFQGRTPPCTDAIIRAGIKKVFIGIRDPNPRVNGKGIEQLKNAGIEIEEGIYIDRIKHQLEYYLLNTEKQRPFVIMKTGMTLDGYIAGMDGSSKWITGEASRKRVHKLRSEVDAIITGIGTVLSDNPRLNNRYIPDSRQPWRVILDNQLQIPRESNLIVTAGKQKTIIFCSQEAEAIKEEQLRNRKVEVIRSRSGRIKIEEVLEELFHKGISVILLEAGEGLVSSFERAGLIDKYYFFIAPKLLGQGKRLISMPEHTNIGQNHKLQFHSVRHYEEDLLIIGYPEQ